MVFWITADFRLKGALPYRYPKNVIIIFLGGRRKNTRKQILEMNAQTRAYTSYKSLTHARSHFLDDRLEFFSYSFWARWYWNSKCNVVSTGHIGRWKKKKKEKKSIHLEDIYRYIYFFTCTWANRTGNKLTKKCTIFHFRFCHTIRFAGWLW